MYTHLQSDALGNGFRLFAGEQRAVGELMIERTPELCRCMGFAAFLKQRKADEATLKRDIDHWLDPLREDIKQMATDVEPFETRLVRIQHSLIDLLYFLDSQYIRFPKDSRTKV